MLVGGISITILYSDLGAVFAVEGQPTALRAPSAPRPEPSWRRDGGDGAASSGGRIAPFSAGARQGRPVGHGLAPGAGLFVQLLAQQPASPGPAETDAALSAADGAAAYRAAARLTTPDRAPPGPEIIVWPARPFGQALDLVA